MRTHLNLEQTIFIWLEVDHYKWFQSWFYPRYGDLWSVKSVILFDFIIAWNIIKTLCLNESLWYLISNKRESSDPI